MTSFCPTARSQVGWSAVGVPSSADADQAAAQDDVRGRLEERAGHRRHFQTRGNQTGSRLDFIFPVIVMIVCPIRSSLRTMTICAASSPITPVQVLLFPCNLKEEVIDLLTCNRRCEHVWFDEPRAVRLLLPPVQTHRRRECNHGYCTMDSFCACAENQRGHDRSAVRANHRWRSRCQPTPAVSLLFSSCCTH